MRGCTCFKICPGCDSPELNMSISRPQLSFQFRCWPVNICLVGANCKKFLLGPADMRFSLSDLLKNSQLVSYRVPDSRKQNTKRGYSRKVIISRINPIGSNGRQQPGFQPTQALSRIGKFLFLGNLQCAKKIQSFAIDAARQCFTMEYCTQSPPNESISVINCLHIFFRPKSNIFR